ncbi:peroxisomal N(1)-acetyl-spermine/spermidine oxidase-like isoform X2 [Protopterus annectens]|uniref:peroxisomal N(1)-acetyl-spermine/spermidine oxidase-like isoform X2 n=1 Tax=Protopterus annectens TaxID=7888 RepID=UPI001CFC15E6|nr:peroxisomal N(1)-acetyl-spermine/spermidine oxidase-like isoform X2 [Protopterus annectens]
MAAVEASVSPRIVIIGCGIAGISAAQRLFSHGYRDLTVVEATARPGGRIKTTEFGKGLVEIGANWIHGPSKENPVFQLACRYGLLDAEAMSEENQAIETKGHPPYPPVSYSSSGKIISFDECLPVRQLYESILAKAGEQRFRTGNGPAASVGEFVKTEAAEEMKKWRNVDKEKTKLNHAVLNTLLKLECCICGAHSMDHVGLASFGEYESLPGLDCTFPRGYHSLIKSMMKPLPKDIFSFGKAVHCIHWQGSFQGNSSSGRIFPVLVEFQNGGKLQADHVIVTVPLGYLKHHYRTFFHPPLPSAKVESIQKISFGTNNKIFLEFEKPFWEPDCYYIELIWEDESPFADVKLDLQKDWFRKLIGFTVLQPPEKFGHVLCGWIAGYESEYMENLSDDEVLNVITQLLRRFTGNHPCSSPKKVLRTKWHNDPYTKGSYSCPGVGCTGDNIDVLAEPLPAVDQVPLQVLFAGEATHRTFYSTTHGALLSGRREADRIIHFYTAEKLNSKL